LDQKVHVGAVKEPPFAAGDRFFAEVVEQRVAGELHRGTRHDRGPCASFEFLFEGTQVLLRGRLAKQVEELDGIALTQFGCGLENSFTRNDQEKSACKHPLRVS
jgi:hypothetical protein